MDITIPALILSLGVGISNNVNGERVEASGNPNLLGAIELASDLTIADQPLFKLSWIKCAANKERLHGHGQLRADGDIYDFSCMPELWLVNNEWRVSPMAGGGFGLSYGWVDGKDSQGEQISERGLTYAWEAGVGVQALLFDEPNSPRLLARVTRYEGQNVDDYRSLLSLSIPLGGLD